MSDNEKKRDDVISIFLKNLKVHHWLLIILMAGFPTIGGSVMNRLTGDTSDYVKADDFRMNRKLDSLKEYYWKRDNNERLDTLDERTKRIETLLNRRK